MNQFTEVHFIAAAVLAVVCLAIGYRWGRANGIRSEKERRRRPRGVERVKSRRGDTAEMQQ